MDGLDFDREDDVFMPSPSPKANHSHLHQQHQQLQQQQHHHHHHQHHQHTFQPLPSPTGFLSLDRHDPMMSPGLMPPIHGLEPLHQAPPGPQPQQLHEQQHQTHHHHRHHEGEGIDWIGAAHEDDFSGVSSPISTNVSAHDSVGSPVSPHASLADVPSEPLPSGLCAEAMDHEAPLMVGPLEPEPELNIPDVQWRADEAPPVPPLAPQSAPAGRANGPRPVSVRSSASSVASSGQSTLSGSDASPRHTAVAPPRASSSSGSSASHKRSRSEMHAGSSDDDDQATREKRRKEGNRAAARRHRLKNKLLKQQNERKLEEMTCEVKSLRRKNEEATTEAERLRAENERLRQQSGVLESLVREFGSALPDAARQMIEKARRANVMMFTLFACFLLTSPYLLSSAPDASNAAASARFGDGAPSPAGRRLLVWDSEADAEGLDVGANATGDGGCWGDACADATSSVDPAADAPGGECSGLSCVVDAVLGTAASETLSTLLGSPAKDAANVPGPGLAPGAPLPV